MAGMKWGMLLALLILLLPVCGLADDDEAEEAQYRQKLESHLQARFQDAWKEPSFILESYWMEDGDNGWMMAAYPREGRFYLSILTFENGQLVEDVTSDRALFQEPVVQICVELENEANFCFESGAGMVWTQGKDGLWRLTWVDVPQEDGSILEVDLKAEPENGRDAAHFDAGILFRHRKAPETKNKRISEKPGADSRFFLFSTDGFTLKIRIDYGRKAAPETGFSPSMIRLKREQAVSDRNRALL